MARRVFFSFHYEKDIWRANQVRNSWVTKPDREAAGFWDAASWEEVKKKGEKAIQSWIDNQLKGTSVTVVLIGAETYQRDWVIYEIQKSCERKNGILGIYIHNMKDQFGRTDVMGTNPFSRLHYTRADGTKLYLSDIYPIYDWITNLGYYNMGDWIEESAKKAGK